MDEEMRIIKSEFEGWFSSFGNQFGPAVCDVPLFYQALQRILNKIDPVDYNLVRSIIEEAIIYKYPTYDVGRVALFAEQWALRAEAVSDFLRYAK